MRGVQQARQHAVDTPRHSCNKLHATWAHPAHICSGTGLTPLTSAPGLGLAPPTSAPGLGSPRPHLLRDWAHALQGL
jgi:hypothetical protein